MTSPTGILQPISIPISMPPATCLLCLGVIQRWVDHPIGLGRVGESWRTAR